MLFLASTAANAGNLSSEEFDLDVSSEDHDKSEVVGDSHRCPNDHFWQCWTLFNQNYSTVISCHLMALALVYCIP